MIWGQRGRERKRGRGAAGRADAAELIMVRVPLFATHLRFSFDETQVPLSGLRFPGDALKKENNQFSRWAVANKHTNPLLLDSVIV